MKKIVLLFLTTLISATVASQNITVGEMLSWKEDLSNAKYDVVKQKMEQAFHGRIDEAAPDSIRYYYYIINAAIEGQGNNNPILKIEYGKNALEIREKRLGILDPEYIELLWAIGTAYIETDIDSAAFYYQKAIVTGETIIKNMHIIDQSRWEDMINNYEVVMGELANIYEKKGRLNEVVELYNEGHSLFSSNTYMFKDQLAWFYRRNHNYEMAIDAFNEALTLINERIGKNNEHYVRELFFKANVLSENGQESESLATYKEVIKLATNVLEPNDELWSDLYGNYYIELGEAGDIASMSEISAIARQKVPRNASLTLDYYDCLALQKANRIDESIALSSSYYSRMREENLEESQLYLDFFNLFVDNYRLKNDLDSIIFFCESEKKHLKQKELSSKSLAYFDACNAVGVEYLKQNKLKEAMSNFQEGERFCSSVFDKENNRHAILYHNIGRCYMLQKDYNNARSYLVKSKELQVKLFGTPNERTLLYLQEVESNLKD